MGGGLSDAVIPPSVRQSHLGQLGAHCRSQLGAQCLGQAIRAVQTADPSAIGGGISSRHAIPCSNRATVHISDGCLPLKFGLMQTWNNFSGVFLFWSPCCVLHYVACLLGRRFGGSYTKLMACVDIPFVLPCLEANCKAAISKHSEHWYVVDVSVSLQ